MRKKCHLKKIRQSDQEEEAWAGARLIRYGGDFKKLIFCFLFVHIKYRGDLSNDKFLDVYLPVFTFCMFLAIFFVCLFVILKLTCSAGYCYGARDWWRDCERGEGQGRRLQKAQILPGGAFSLHFLIKRHCSIHIFPKGSAALNHVFWELVLHFLFVANMNDVVLIWSRCSDTIRLGWVRIK